MIAAYQQKRQWLIMNQRFKQVYSQQEFPPLESVTRPTVPTDAAAYYLNRRPQTLRVWACLENGTIRPVRISGRLAWPVSDIKALLAGRR
jgi:hypothetical protein